MGLGVLEDRHMEMPPGTTRLADKLDHGAEAVQLKRSGDIILVPQPSDDPNDPLNWYSPNGPNWTKNVIMIILGISVAVTTSLGPMITPGLHLLSTRYHVSADEVDSLMLGALQFCIGFTTFFTAAGATIWGKRPFFVISALVLLATCAWGYTATTWRSLVAMRFIQGMASAPLETLVTASVADLFFVHERGSRLAIWGMMVHGGVGIGQVISGFIIQALGVQATFGVCALWFLVLAPLIFGLVFETTYMRKRGEWEPAAGTEMQQLPEKTGKLPLPDEKEPHRARLRLWRGRLSADSYWKAVVKPVPLICYPAIAYSAVVHGSFFVWLVVMGLLSLQVFTAPPYNLSPAQIGLTNIPHVVVALVCSPIAGVLSDWVAKSMARRNAGVFEPEFRLPLMAIATPFATLGFLGFGLAVERRASLPVILVFQNLQAVSVPFASQAALTYLLDCHPRDTNQAFVTVGFVKAVLMFLATSRVAGWYAGVGPWGVMVVCAVANAGVSVLTVPVYVFGKRWRSKVSFFFCA
ncbi:MFS general substrate transporter [Trichodelitschia bisporula]|uniref:MFS general substrate transporter n=1 Tax=Trichodelitschia bisporula TaxID=703511 RepID=A0A6G1I3T6_9PEZI|nr:MFS general substrate transporter [Trichodelitschia bisporula]